MIVLDTQLCKLCWGFSASKCMCLLFLTFCKHLEGRELGMLFSMCITIHSTGNREAQN